MQANFAEPLFNKHPHFDLMLPSNQMLERHVQARVTTRLVCHEWPLSCVERVVFDGGMEKYCKTMRAPSREIEAYRSLQSPLLVRAIILAESEDSSAILLDCFSGSRLTKNALEREGLSNFLDSLKRGLSEIQGVGPVFVDLSTIEKVTIQMNEMLDRLRRRFGGEAPRRIDSDLLQVAERCATNPLVQAAFIQDAIYTNGDLSADNILLSDNEMRVIDWQFPRIASFDVECVNLFTSLGLDPRERLPDSVIAAALLCKIRWLAECADVWLTGCDYQEEIESLLGALRSPNLRT
jgi:hypothetical protein